MSYSRQKGIKVVHIVGGGLRSGAGRGVLNLHRGLRDIGIDSHIVVTSRRLDLEEDGISLFAERGWGKYWASGLRLADRALGRTFADIRRLTPGVVGANPLKSNIVKSADIVNLHWIRGSPSIWAIGRSRVPVVMTLRDMWGFTGGCHYSLGCDHYKSGCGYCPVLNSKWKYDRSRVFHYMKRVNWSRDNIYPVGISPWVCGEADKSGIFKNRAQLIWNGINREVFKPIDKDKAIALLGLDPRFRYLAIGAISINDACKGGGLLPDILANLKEVLNRNTRLLIFGGGDEALVTHSGIIRFGRVQDDEKLNLIYSASHAFLVPSVEEAFGKTIAESLASGTPVIAFNATGPSCILDHLENGYLAKPYSIKDFIDGAKWLIGLPKEHYDDIVNKSVRRSEQFCQKRNAKQYADLYESILQRGGEVGLD